MAISILDILPAVRMPSDLRVDATVGRLVAPGAARAILDVRFADRVTEVVDANKKLAEENAALRKQIQTQKYRTKELLTATSGGLLPAFEKANLV